MSSHVTSVHPFAQRAEALLGSLRAKGEYKQLQTIDGPMGPSVRIVGDDRVARDVLCFCSNNYLGLANHPEVVEAGIKALRDFGAGTASVRFICGTFGPHLALERRIAEFLDVEAAYVRVVLECERGTVSDIVRAGRCDYQ